MDSSFGENGIVRTEFAKEGLLTSSASSALLQPDGKIVLCGQGSTKTFEHYTTLVRYNNDINKRQIIATRIRRWLQHHGITWQGNKNVRYYTVQRSLDGGITYQIVAKWYNNKPVYNYEDATQTANACYRVAITAKSGERLISNTIFMDETAGAKVYPNPVRSSLQLQGLPTDSKIRISILDFTGNVRTTAIAGSSSTTINTANLTPGNYLLKLQHNNSVTTQTFVKE